MSEIPSDSSNLHASLESRKITCQKRLSKREKLFAFSIYIGTAFFLLNCPRLSCRLCLMFSAIHLTTDNAIAVASTVIALAALAVAVWEGVRRDVIIVFP
jgi:hypothetical protein